MSLSPLVRTYTMADGDLVQRADALLQSINRDSVDFATRGVDAARIQTLLDARDRFDTFSTDEELQGLVNEQVRLKDALRHDVEVSVRAIRNMADIQYQGKGLYNTFGFADLTHLTDNDLHRLVSRVVRVAARLLPDLARQGLDTARIRALEDLGNRFDTAIEAVGNAVEVRDIETQTRVSYGNALFERVTEMASVGKSLYEDKDEARYNDYIIYDKPSSPPSPPVV